jgi:hypothetical protein
LTGAKRTSFAIALRFKNDPKLKFVDRYPHHGSRTFSAAAKLGRSAAAAA